MTHQPILNQLSHTAKRLAQLYPMLSAPLRTRPDLSPKRRQQLVARLEAVLGSLHGVDAAISLLHRTPEDVLDADLAALVAWERERAGQIITEGWAVRLLARAGG